ncbi:Ig-like domain-containing protein [Natrinema sp. CBA1119]|uniref:Ig-like domain-containing protein n=1 Tax=Natrinema sp. CBA1119 TaxID=1608465 RepID=UPI00114607D0|nr:Ig-like domain-containing protein [Natrinema sp. CBA1119]
MRKLIIISIAVVVLLSISVAPTVAQTDDWPDDSHKETTSGSHTGLITSNDDSDQFQVPVSSNSVIDLSLSKEAGQEVYADISYPGGSSYLRNDGGTGESTQVTIEEDGFVYVDVEGQPGTSEDFSWGVSVNDTGVRDQWNDEADNQVGLGSHTGEINSNDDLDTFQVPVSANSVIDLSLSKQIGQEVYADISYPGGSSYLRNDGGTGDSDQVTVEEDGFVYVDVEGEPGTSDDFSWEVSVNDTGARDQWNDEADNQVGLGSHTGEINSNDDLDTFQVPVSANSVIDLSLSKQIGQEVYADISYPGGSSYLRNDGGTGDSDQVTVEEDGFVYVDVEGEPGASDDFSWEVLVNDTGVRDQWNDEADNQVSLGSHTGEINSNDDLDAFQIPVSGSTELDIGLSKNSGQDVHADIRYPGGSSYLSNEEGSSDSTQVTVEEDGFVYVDIEGESGTGEDFPWTVTVREAGSGPSANDVSVLASEGTPVTGTFDARDPNGDSLSYAVTSGPNHGTVSTNGDSFTYTPESGYSGTDSFTYEVSDGNGGTATATVTINVTENSSEYENEEGIVDTPGLQAGIDDWRAGTVSTTKLRAVIGAWRTGSGIN